MSKFSSAVQFCWIFLLCFKWFVQVYEFKRIFFTFYYSLKLISPQFRVIKLTFDAAWLLLYLKQCWGCTSSSISSSTHGMKLKRTPAMHLPKRCCFFRLSFWSHDSYVFYRTRTIFADANKKLKIESVLLKALTPDIQYHFYNQNIICSLFLAVNLGLYKVWLSSDLTKCMCSKLNCAHLSLKCWWPNFFSPKEIH